MMRYLYLLYLPVLIALLIYFLRFLNALSELATTMTPLEAKMQETERLLTKIDNTNQVLENYQKKNQKFIITVALVPFLFSQIRRLFKKKKKKQPIRITDIAALAQTIGSLIK